MRYLKKFKDFNNIKNTFHTWLCHQAPLLADDSIIEVNNDESLLIMSIVNGNTKFIEIEILKKKLENIFNIEIDVITSKEYFTFEIPVIDISENGIEKMKSWIKIQRNRKFGE